MIDGDQRRTARDSSNLEAHACLSSCQSGLHPPPQFNLSRPRPRSKRSCAKSAVRFEVFGAASATDSSPSYSANRDRHRQTRSGNPSQTVSIPARPASPEILKPTFKTQQHFRHGSVQIEALSELPRRSATRLAPTFLASGVPINAYDL